MSHNIALAADALLLAFALGATIWFFFVQSPVLLKWMGKERFIPIQMRLTKVLFASLSVAIPLMLGAAFVHGYDQFWLHVATAGVALFGALANTFVVVPRALRAGGKALKEGRGQEEDNSVAGFASTGAGDASKLWHRLVVVFVVVMLGGLCAHGAVLMGAASAV